MTVVESPAEEGTLPCRDDGHGQDNMPSTTALLQVTSRGQRRKRGPSHDQGVLPHWKRVLLPIFSVSVVPTEHSLSHSVAGLWRQEALSSPQVPWGQPLPDQPHFWARTTALPGSIPTTLVGPGQNEGEGPWADTVPLPAAGHMTLRATPGTAILLLPFLPLPERKSPPCLWFGVFSSLQFVGWNSWELLNLWAPHSADFQSSFVVSTSAESAEGWGWNSSH